MSDDYGPATYGDRIAGIYDQWVEDVGIGGCLEPAAAAQAALACATGVVGDREEPGELRLGLDAAAERVEDVEKGRLECVFGVRAIPAIMARRPSSPSGEAGRPSETGQPPSFAPCPSCPGRGVVLIKIAFDFL